MKTATKYILAAKQAKELAGRCIKAARSADRKAYFTHREVEILPLNSEGERAEMDQPEWMPLAQLSGKTLQAAAERLQADHPKDCKFIGVGGGVDAYESFSEKMAAARDLYDADYEPYGGGTWDGDQIEL